MASHRGQHRRDPLRTFVLPERDVEWGPRTTCRLCTRHSTTTGSLGWTWSCNADISEPIRKGIARLNGERHTGANLDVTVAGLGLVAGESAEVWFEALDNNPRLSPIPGRLHGGWYVSTAPKMNTPST